jgi:hypothetical protein
MAYPTIGDYSAAMQNLRWNVSDEELQQGQVALLDALGLPAPCAGGYAAVYKVHCPATRNTWAVKCFTKDIKGHRERYAEIDACLKQARLPFMVDFQYIEPGILVGGQRYPFLKMRWVEGLKLNQFVEQSLDGQSAMLQQLLRLWVRLSVLLREKRIAHADLQHGNVLLVPRGDQGQLSLKLIDYDGMYVPGLAGKNSDEVGLPGYQHPQRMREGIYNAEVDRFSHLVIYSAVRCLTLEKGLWPSYDTGENLLFCQKDFDEPGESKLFRELWGLRHPEIRGLTGRLLLATQAPLERVPLLEEVVRGGKVLPLGRKEEQAVEAILATGKPSLAVAAAAAGTVPEPVVSGETAAATMPSPPGLIPWPAGEAQGGIRSAGRLLRRIAGQGSTTAGKLSRVGLAAAVLLAAGLGLARLWLEPHAARTPAPPGRPRPDWAGPNTVAPVTPRLVWVGPNTVATGRPLSASVQARGLLPGGGNRRFFLRSGPVGATLNPDTGTVTWTPTPDQRNHVYKFDVSMATGSGPADSASFAVFVTSLRAPLVAPLNWLALRLEYPRMPKVGKLVRVPMSVSNAESGDGVLTFTIVNSPPEAAINGKTGEITWTPHEEGSHSFTVRAVVACGRTGETTFSIYVSPRTPLYFNTGAETARIGKPFGFRLRASNGEEDDGALTFTLISGPPGTAIDKEGQITWIPKPSDAGSQRLTFHVGTASGRTGEANLFVAVLYPLPLHFDSINPPQATIGTPFSVTVSVSGAEEDDGEPTFTLVDGPAEATIGKETGEITWTPPPSLRSLVTRFTVRADTSTGRTARTTFFVNVLRETPSPRLQPAAKSDLPRLLLPPKTLQLLVTTESVRAGELLTCSVAVSNPKGFKGLHYSLKVPPKSRQLGAARINSWSGTFTWKPPAKTPPKTYEFNISVEDANHQKDEKVLRVTVLPAPRGR